MSNSIIDENKSFPGTNAFKFKTNLLATIEIQGYVDSTSYNPGDTVTFYVSTQNAGDVYSIAIYRMGWYDGYGARLITTLSSLTGQAQGYSDATTITNCPTAIIDSTTHLIETGWAASTTWTIPGNAVTGCYLVQFTAPSGKQSLANFVVKGNTTADYVYVRPYCTDTAYNAWGGWSLYTNPGVGVKVSLNRPGDVPNGGSGNFLFYELAAIKWMEKQGYNISYVSDIDIHNNAAQLLNYKALISPGHDEYWTKAKRDGVEAMIAAGKGAAFLGANASYWQIRMENDNAGHANRTVVCYRGLAASTYGPYSNDPMYGVNNALMTSQWRDPILNRPESAMIGIMYSDNTHANNIAWSVAASPSTTYFAGSGLVAGQSYGGDLVGNEWDKQQTGSPSNLQIIGQTTTTNSNSQADTSHTTTYKAPSGALVFASGSLDWTWALDNYRRYSPTTTDNLLVVPGIQLLMQNIMGALKGSVASQVSL